MSKTKEVEDRWDMLSAMQCVKRNGGKIDKSRQITHMKAGIKVLGAIDYLINYHNFTKGRKI